MPRTTRARALAAPLGEYQLALNAFLTQFSSREQRVAAIEKALDGESGRFWRRQLGLWTISVVPVDELVPKTHEEWRPLVRDAMRFTMSHLSAPRLASRIVEQTELAPETPVEIRLLSLIAKVPGLQKIGQMLARNRNLHPRFRRALSQLENGISDVGIEEIRTIILRELGPQIRNYRVKLDAEISSEASVSAVVLFTWLNPANGERERGVFKVLKPHIPSCFAEDMRILQGLTRYLIRKYLRDPSRFAALPETLTEIRLLLEREVDFRREQRTLAIAARFYCRMRGVRVPELIEPLSTDIITALTYEKGVKVTQISKSKPKLRARVAQKVAETLLAAPAFTRKKEVVFHGDPHAGNLLYDSRTDTLVVLDWALTEHLNWADRRLIVLLVFKTMLRDSDGMVAVIERLRIHRKLNDSLHSQAVRRCVRDLLESLPFLKVPGPMSAFELLERLAVEGIRFPPALVVFRKAAFTLGGVVEDIAGKAVNIDSVLQRFAVDHWFATGATYCSLLSTADWLGLQWSAVTFGSRVLVDGISRPPRWLWRLGRGGLSLLPEIAGRITTIHHPRVLPMSGAARFLQRSY